MVHQVVQLLGPSTGGIRAHVAELDRLLPDRDWLSTTVGPAHVMDGVGAQRGTVEVPTGWNPRALRQANRQLRDHVASRAGVEVLHVHGLKAALVAESLRERPPTVLTVHNLVAGTQHGPQALVLSAVERAILRRADHVIAISDEIEARLDGLVAPERRSFVLPASPRRTQQELPEAVRARHGIAAAAPLVVIVARLHQQKDLPTFLRAIDRLRQSRPEVRAVVVGDGPERASLEAASTRLHLDDVVVFAGHRPNPIDEILAADVVALSSSWEGSPLVIAEYLAAGRPLVTTAVGTVPRHLTNGVDARIVAVGDDAAFSAALLAVLDDREGATAMATAGLAVAERVFDADRLVDQVVDVYARTVAAGRR